MPRRRRARFRSSRPLPVLDEARHHPIDRIDLRGEPLMQPSCGVAKPARERVVGDDAEADLVRDENNPCLEAGERR